MINTTKLRGFGFWAMTRCVKTLNGQNFVKMADIAQNGTPLVPEQIFQDVTAEHAFKTVTIEAFPHSTSLQAASVHPCRHASVMKKVIERMNAGVVEEQLAQRKSSGKEGKK